MGHYKVSLVVGGAINGEDYFDSANATLAYIDVLKTYDYGDNIAEVFVLYHDHDYQDECLCIQYELDSSPFWTNKEAS